MQRSLKKELNNLTEKPVQWDCSLARYTSFYIGGPAEALVVVDNQEELQEILRFSKERSIALRVIGKGTNLLVRDQGYRGIVLVLGDDFRYVQLKNEIEKDLVKICVGSGHGLTKLSHWCVEKGYSGLEFASGIPGTVGGALMMNAGAWGSSMENVVHSATVITASKKIEYSKDALQFCYRSLSNVDLTQKDSVVVEVTFSLRRERSQEMEKKISTYLAKRRKSQPLNLPNAGSIFKNPPNDSAGRLIEASGLKGVQVGGAEISTVHANFIVNRGTAKADDVLTLMNLVQEKVKKDSRVELEPEVHIL